MRSTYLFPISQPTTYLHLGYFLVKLMTLAMGLEKFDNPQAQYYSWQDESRYGHS